MEKLIERVAKAPLGAKVGAVAAVVAAVTALNWFVIGMPRLGPSVMEIEAKIAKAATEQRKLDGDLMEKTAIANNINQFRKEKEQLEQRLQEALAELPNEKQIDELLQLFQDRAQKSGLEIVTVEPQAPVSEGFYARLPIPMAVSGSFHEVATFFDAIGRLRRIVNVSNITMDGAKESKGRVIVSAKFLATAFMFVEQPKDAPAAPAKGAKKPAKKAAEGSDS
jgi:type IV pilus assembly protein PilO